MGLCREQARSLVRVGSHLPLDTRASQLERAGTIGRRSKTIDQWEDLPLQIIHMRSVSAATPQSSPARVANQNCRSSPIPNSSLGLPNPIMSVAASNSAFRVNWDRDPQTGFTALPLTQRGEGFRREVGSPLYSTLPHLFVVSVAAVGRILPTPFFGGLHRLYCEFDFEQKHGPPGRVYVRPGGRSASNRFGRPPRCAAASAQRCDCRPAHRAGTGDHCG